MTNISLSRGQLALTVHSTHADWQLEELLGFAERINPKRAFLFVSKVLGRHIPVAPALMRRAFTDLAQLIPANLPEPVLVVGMAETATGLGAGVHSVLQARYPEAIFVTTTRHLADSPLLGVFLEEHSHAKNQRIYHAHDPILQQRINYAKTLIVVDDEMSTGKTLVNLVHSLQQAGLQQLSHIVSTSLVDWATDDWATPLVDKGLHCQAVSLLKGAWQWHENTMASVPMMPKVDSVGEGNFACLSSPTWGRVPCDDTRFMPSVKVCQFIDELSAEHPKRAPRLLVLGSGEYVWAPFLLAEQLHKALHARFGVDCVQFSATTRSPIMLGGAIHAKLDFCDNYGLGIANFLYNVRADDYDKIILCVETVAESVDKALLQALPNMVVVSAQDYPLVPVLSDEAL